MTTDIYSRQRPPASITMVQRTDSFNRYREQHNPLRGLTIARAVSLLEAAQRGEYADLMWLYKFCEENDATPFALVDRRTSALLEMDYDIKIVDSKVAKRSGALATEQQDALREKYDRITNLYDAFEHLAMASFRMFSIIQPRHSSAGDVTSLECLDQWNFLRDGLYGDWYWNPDARVANWRSMPKENLLNPDDLIIRAMNRHIDRIVLSKYIRKGMGEKDWSSFVEVYGLPGHIVIGPQNVPQGREAEYEAAGLLVAEGGSGYLPYGSTVHTSDGVRGVNPFRDYIRYCDEQIVLAGTGGMLTMLAESGSGTLAGNAHADTFKAIAIGEARKISEVLQAQFDARELAKDFPGQPVLAYFSLAATEEKDVGKILDNAVKAKNAGYQVDTVQLSEDTGLKLTLIPAQGPVDGFGSSTGQPPSGLTNAVGGAALLNRQADPEPIGALLADARVQVAAAQQSDFEALARPLQELYAKAGTLTTEELIKSLRAIQETLPGMVAKVGADSETSKALESLMGTALANALISQEANK